MLQIQCANCKQALQAQDSAAGKTIRCPRCNQTMTLPTGAAAEMSNDTELDVPGLGNLVKEYRPRRWWIGLIVFALLFLVNIPFTVAAFRNEAKRNPLIAAAMIPNGAWLVGIIICGGFSLIGLKQRIFLHERGLTMSTLFRAAEVRWTEIKGVRLVDAGMFNPTMILLDLEGKPELDLPSAVKKNEELADRIIAATAPLIKARVNKALDRGEIVAFGPFMSVSPKGLQFQPDAPRGETHKLRWDRIKSVSTGLFQTNPTAGGLAAGASVRKMMHVTPTTADLPWVCAIGNIANLAVFLDVLGNRFGVKVS